VQRIQTDAKGVEKIADVDKNPKKNNRKKKKPEKKSKSGDTLNPEGLDQIAEDSDEKA
jgi:hypothetical protein